MIVRIAAMESKILITLAWSGRLVMKIMMWSAEPHGCPFPIGIKDKVRVPR